MKSLYKTLLIDCSVSIGTIYTIQWITTMVNWNCWSYWICKHNICTHNFSVYRKIKIKCCYFVRPHHYWKRLVAVWTNMVLIKCSQKFDNVLWKEKWNSLRKLKVIFLIKFLYKLATVPMHEFAEIWHTSTLIDFW